MKIFIVMRHVSNGVDSCSYVVKHFIDEKVAQDFADDITLKSMYLREEITKIRNKYTKESAPLQRYIFDRRKETKEEDYKRCKELSELVIEREKQETEAIKKADLGDLFLAGEYDIGEDVLSVDEYEVNMKRK